MDELIKLWMPVEKDYSTGNYRAILSDDSLDRDGEFMSPELLREWAQNDVIPAFKNHENKVEGLLGGWNNLEYIEVEGKSALAGDGFFLDTNPEAQQIKAMVDESLDKGLSMGISITALPKKWTNNVKREDGTKGKRYDKAELLSGDWVGIQSNRNAKTYGKIAKAFGLPHSEDLLEKKVEKRGDKWCVVHCHGQNAGKTIKCFASKKEADKMHRAMQANKDIHDLLYKDKDITDNALILKDLEDYIKMAGNRATDEELTTKLLEKQKAALAKKDAEAGSDDAEAEGSEGSTEEPKTDAKEEGDKKTEEPKEPESKETEEGQDAGESKEASISIAEVVKKQEETNNALRKKIEMLEKKDKAMEKKLDTTAFVKALGPVTTPLSGTEEKSKEETLKEVYGAFGGKNPIKLQY